ncbi:MAG: hypothetical protein ACREDR_33085, partial [Blastocatellia bacterium]
MRNRITTPGLFFRFALVLLQLTVTTVSGRGLVAAPIPFSSIRKTDREIWFERDDRSLGIPFTLYSNHIFLGCRIADSKPLA